ATDQGAVIAIRHKADFHTIRLVVNTQPGLPGNFSDLLFTVPAHRKKQVGQDTTPYAEEDIRLILRRIGPLVQFRPVAAGHNPGVVARSNVVRLKLLAIGPELAELQPIVAHDTGIRCTTG